MSRVRWLLAAVAVVALVMIGSVVALSVVLVPGRDPATIHDIGTLPERISVCGRTWHREVNPHQVTLPEANAMKAGGDAVVVATGPGAPCPPGPCTNVAAGACDTVVWVRVAENGYVAYELSGGP